MKLTYQKYLSLALMLLCLGATLLVCGYLRMEQVSGRIAEQILRFHVIANSDSDEDQALKLKVKEALLAVLNQSGADSLEEMKAYVDAHRAALIQTAEEVVAAEGYDYPVWLTLGETYFPTKVYGDLTFPCGSYQALRITLGEGAGKNWWCVLYPPLCFVDITTGIVPDNSKAELEEVLTDEDYGSLEGEPVVFRFRIFEWLWKFFK